VTEPDLNFIAERLLAIQTEQTAVHTDIAAVRVDLVNIADGQTVLGQMILRLERDMVRIKDLLGRIDGRIAHLEKVVLGSIS
jgi:hypothetical protein